MGFDEFDEEAYVRANPDVAVMVARGLFRSPRDHWDRTGSLEHSNGRRRSGFFEHDLMYDEETYLRQNPDVLRLVRARSLTSGYEHWMRHGRVEFSRGRRHAPFVATKHALRAFRLPLGEAGTLVVGAVEADPRGPTSTYRHGDEAPAPVDAAAVAWTEPLGIVDVCHRPVVVRLALVRLPGLPGLEGKRPRPLAVLSSQSAGGAPLLVARDAGLQAFAFATASDANVFFQSALGLAGTEAANRDFAERVTAFCVARLHRPPDADEPFTGFVLESLVRRGGGFDASGWLSPASEDVASVSVWCPETGECAELTSLTRVARPDVTQSIGSVRGVSADAPLGFRAFLPLPRASALTPARLVFGVTLKSGVPRWFDRAPANLL